MKLHLLCGKDIKRPFLSYIKIKNDFVYVTDAHAFAKIPIEMVFPEGLISSKEEVYFQASEWRESRIWESTSVTREGNLFQVHHAKKPSFVMLASKDSVGYPEFESFINRQFNPIEAIYLDAKLLYKVQDALGLPGLIMRFREKNKMITLECTENTSLTAGIMPLQSDWL